ncbi:MAG: xanthine phosphoribosyltransferase [Alphaproteobacteria bacterium]|nr:xanthine phosphoribosyltransferase [Alphaproteobacteria bacterium]
MATSENYTKDFPVLWEELHRNGKALAWKLLNKGPLEEGKWKGIIAVTRGGMVPACIVARELEVLMIETFCITSYDVKDQSETKILKKPNSVDNDGEGWIVVDDLVDTGKTFELARTLYPKAHYACIYVKPKGQKQTDTFVTAFSQDTWVHFPWDLENQYATPLARKDK